MATLTQEHRPLAIDTPLGPDALVLASFSGHEELSRLFHYRLEMVSEQDSIAAKKIVGKSVTFKIKLADGSERYFNGVVSRFSAGDRRSGSRSAPPGPADRRVDSPALALGPLPQACH